MILKLFTLSLFLLSPYILLANADNNNINQFRELAKAIFSDSGQPLTMTQMESLINQIISVSSTIGNQVPIDVMLTYLDIYQLTMLKLHEISDTCIIDDLPAIRASLGVYMNFEDYLNQKWAKIEQRCRVYFQGRGFGPHNDSNSNSSAFSSMGLSSIIQDLEPDLSLSIKDEDRAKRIVHLALQDFIWKTNLIKRSPDLEWGSYHSDALSKLRRVQDEICHINNNRRYAFYRLKQYFQIFPNSNLLDNINKTSLDNIIRNLICIDFTSSEYESLIRSVIAKDYELSNFYDTIFDMNKDPLSSSSIEVLMSIMANLNIEKDTSRSRKIIKQAAIGMIIPSEPSDSIDELKRIIKIWSMREQLSPNLKRYYLQITYKYRNNFSLNETDKMVYFRSWMDPKLAELLNELGEMKHLTKWLPDQTIDMDLLEFKLVKYLLSPRDLENIKDESVILFKIADNLELMRQFCAFLIKNQQPYLDRLNEIIQHSTRSWWRMLNWELKSSASNMLNGYKVCEYINLGYLNPTNILKHAKRA